MKDRRMLVDLEVCEFMALLKQLTLSTDGFINHMGVSRSKFYKMKKDDNGFPRAHKMKGFKELVYELGDVEKYLAALKQAGMS